MSPFSECTLRRNARLRRLGNRRFASRIPESRLHPQMESNLHRISHANRTSCSLQLRTPSHRQDADKQIARKFSGQDAALDVGPFPARQVHNLRRSRLLMNPFRRVAVRAHLSLPLLACLPLAASLTLALRLRRAVFVLKQGAHQCLCLRPDPHGCLAVVRRAANLQQLCLCAVSVSGSAWRSVSIAGIGSWNCRSRPSLTCRITPSLRSVRKASWDSAEHTMQPTSVRIPRPPFSNKAL